MSKEALKRWRLIIPGVIFLLAILPILSCQFGINIEWDTKNVLLVVVCIVLGGLYDLLNLRRFAMKAPIKGVRENIREKLSAPFRGEVGFEQLNALSTAEFLRIFYSIVDNDNSLSDQSNDVRLNGLYLSTACDIKVLSLVASIVYIVLAILIFYSSGQMASCVQSALLVSLLLFCSSFALVYFATREHLELGNEQLAHITNRKELAESLREKLEYALKNIGSK